MDAKRTQVLVAASMAGLLAAVVSGVTARAADTAAPASKIPCYGINKCKGTGECGGKGHSCAGKNECASQGYLSLDKDTCLKIQNGRLTVDKPAA